MKEGTKLDDGKLRWDLLPLAEIEEVVKVLTYGAEKYAPDNWQKVETPIERYYAAMMRHITAWRAHNESLDKESGLPHLAHAICCLVFIVWHERRMGC